MEKKFKIKSNEIKTILKTNLGCIASDMITVNGEPIKYLYREVPTADYDSGWRFFSGNETQEYTDDPNNFNYYKLNTIANYDSSILDILELPIGITLEFDESLKKFIDISDQI